LPSTYKAEARFRVKKNSGVSLTLNRSFLNLQREAEATGKFVLCLQLSKLKLGLELKKIVRLAVTHLPVCSFLVLTHNFEVGRPVIARMEMFIILGMLLQRG